MNCILPEQLNRRTIISGGTVKLSGSGASRPISSLLEIIQEAISRMVSERQQQGRWKRKDESDSVSVSGH